MRITLINQYAGGPSLGMEYRPHWMASRWQERHQQVLIVCGDRSHLRHTAQIPTGMSDRDQVPFLSLPTTPYRVNGPARFANLLSFNAALRASMRRLREFQPDLVVASSTHPLDVRPAYNLARRTGAGFVFEVHDLWPLTPILLGGLSPSHPVIRLMRREEAFAYRHADLVVSLLPGTETYMRARGLPAGRWMWVPNGVADQPVVTGSRSAALEALGKRIAAIRAHYPDVVIYAGGHGPSNALDHLLVQAPVAQQLGIAIVLVGAGPLKPELRERYGHEPNVHFCDAIPRADVADALRLADFAYAGAAPSPLYAFGISFNKIYDYMSAGIPVVENIGAANSPVREAGCGVVADPADPGSLHVALRQMASASPQQRQAWGRSGARYVAEHLRQADLADRMLDAMARVAAR